MPTAARVLPYALAHRAAGRPRGGPGRAAGGLLLRGVVLAVWPPGSTSRGRDRSAAAAVPSWVCDVLIFEPTYRTILYNVPIMVEQGGVDNYTARVPTPTTGTISGQPLVISPEGAAQNATPAHDMNGDYVLIAFLGDDLNQPFVLGQLPHPATNRTVQANAASQQYVRGTSTVIDDGGNVAVNLIESSGEISYTLGAGNLATGKKFQILQDTGSNPEAVMRGESFLNDYAALLTDLTAAFTEISGLLAGLGLLAPTTTGTVLPNLATYSATAAASLSAGLPYLSSHLEVD